MIDDKRQLWPRARGDAESDQRPSGLDALGAKGDRSVHPQRGQIKIEHRLLLDSAVAVLLSD